MVVSVTAATSWRVTTMTITTLRYLERSKTKLLSTLTNVEVITTRVWSENCLSTTVLFIRRAPIIALFVLRGSRKRFPVLLIPCVTRRAWRKRPWRMIFRLVVDNMRLCGTWRPSFCVDETQKPRKLGELSFVGFLTLFVVTVGLLGFGNLLNPGTRFAGSLVTYAGGGGGGKNGL